MLKRLPGSVSPTWVVVETVAAATVSLFGLLFIARLIGPWEAGLGAVAVSAFLIVDFPLSALFGDAIVQRRALKERHRSSAFWATIAIAVLVAACLALAAPLIAGWTGMPRLIDMLRVLACLLPLSGAAGLLAGMALRERRYRLLAARVVVCQPPAIGAGIAAAIWFDAGAWALVVQQAVATTMVFALLAWLARWRPRQVLRRSALAELWPVAGPQVLALVVFNGRYRVFIVALGMVATEAVVAVTHVAFRLLDVAMGVVTGATARLAMPRLAALQHDREALAEAYGDLAQLQALCGLPIATGLAIVAPWLLEGMLGGPWLAAAEPARIVALSAVMAFLTGPAASLWLALGKTRVNLAMQLASFALPLFLLAVLRPESPRDIALCWIGSALLVPPVQAWLALRELGRLAGWLAERLFPALLGTAALCATAVPVAVWSQGQPAILALALTGTTGVLAYGAVVTLALRWHWPRALEEV